MPVPKGEKHHWSKLDYEKVYQLRRDYWINAFTIASMSKIWNLPESTIYSAVHWHCWKSLRERFGETSVHPIRLAEYRRHKLVRMFGKKEALNFLKKRP